MTNVPYCTARLLGSRNRCRTRCTSAAREPFVPLDPRSVEAIRLGHGLATDFPHLRLGRNARLVARMKVLLFVRDLAVGGSQRQLAVLAAGLAQRGHDVAV